MKSLSIILLLSSLQAQAIKIYLNDDTGLDTYTSTQAQSQSTPWKTITKLNGFIGSLSAGDSVFFHRGDVFYGTISAPTNGTEGHPIVFAAYGTGAKPIISGFTALGLWSNLGSNIWETTVNSGLNLNLVTVLGVATPQGRTPNAGSYYTVESSNLIGEFPTPPTGSIGSTSLNSAVTNYTGAELVVRTTEYTLDRNFITAVSDTQLTFNSTSYHRAGIGNGFFIQHHPSTMNAQNEWYYNSTDHTLRMYSTSDPSGLSVKAATLDYGFNDDPISDVAFYNLEFQGFDSIGVRFRDGSRRKVTYCDFDLIGADAIVHDGGTRDTISNNTITNICNTGIRNIYSTSPVITYNTIRKAGLIEGMGLSNNQQMDGIMHENAVTGDTAIIEHNTIDSVGYCGIRFTGHNTRIRFNPINHFGLSLSDGGGIYGNGENGFTGLRIIEGNIVQNGYGNRISMADADPGGVPGIYLDDKSANVLITGNTVNNTSRYGIFLHNAHEVDILNNTIVGTTGEAAIGLVHDFLGVGHPTRNVTIKYNLINNPSGLKVLDISSYDDDDIDELGTVDSNYYSRPAAGNIITYSAPSAGGNYSLATWKSTFGYDPHSTMQAIPADSVRLDINATASASVLSLGANTYLNLKNKGYTSNISLLPFTSLLLIKHTLQKAYVPVRFKPVQQ